jgi:hypothetical protein
VEPTPVTPAFTYLTGFSVIGYRAYEATASGDPRADSACLQKSRRAWCG